MGWIFAAIMALIALAAVATIWRRHRSELRRLHRSHQKAVRRLDDEHERRIERLDRQYKNELRSAHHPLTRDLLPALDSLDEALHQLDIAAATTDDDFPDDLRRGVELARRAIDSALARHQIQPVAPEPGDDFDPRFHEAFSRHETADAPPQTIHRLLRRGFRDEEKVLRAALVEVNVAPSQPGSVERELSPESDPSGNPSVSN